MAVYTDKDAGPGDIRGNMTYEEATQLLTMLVAPRKCFS
jgi:hypothetical protein